MEKGQHGCIVLNFLYDVKVILLHTWLIQWLDVFLCRPPSCVQIVAGIGCAIYHHGIMWDLSLIRSMRPYFAGMQYHYEGKDLDYDGEKICSWSDYIRRWHGMEKYESTQPQHTLTNAANALTPTHSQGATATLRFPATAFRHSCACLPDFKSSGRLTFHHRVPLIVAAS